MEFIKIRDFIPLEHAFNNYITLDRKYLHLSYLPLNESYNNFFDQLNQSINTYKTVERLYFETDFINSLPEKIIEFHNLTELNVSGSRFWNLNLLNVPPTLKVLYLTEHSNFNSDCLLGMDKLINLKEIHLNAEAFFLDQLFMYPDRERNQCDRNDIPIANLPNLKIISFVYGGLKSKDEFLENWVELLKADPLFSLINHRIDTITIEDDIVERITITLKI